MINKQNNLRALLLKMNIKASSTDIEKYLILLAELFLWNKKFNLTAIIDPEEALEKHIVDSLTLCSLLQNTQYLLDIGSGAGFPAIPVKIACPQIKIYSVEASRKKVYFQRHIARKLGLKGLKIIHCRAEELKEKCFELPPFDVVASRALTFLPEFLNLARPYLSTSGRVIAMKGPGCNEELNAAVARGEWIKKDQRTFSLPSSGSIRELLVFEPKLK